MTATIHNTIVYFPYLNMGDTDEIDFGFLKIWNFSRLKNERIQDEHIRSHVTTMLEVHRSMNGPMQDIGIVSFGDTGPFSLTQPDQLANIREAKLVLFLSFLARNNTRTPNPNRGHLMATSENFQEIYQNFIVGGDYIAELGGYVVPFSHMNELRKVYRLRPEHVPTPLRFEIDKELFGCLLELKNKRPRVYGRIINAIELFFESYHNSESVSRNARILLQMSAFEILLQLPGRRQRLRFKNKVESLLGLPGEKQYVYYYENGQGNRQKETRTRKGIWADRFYTLRNHIIHGSTPPDSDYVLSFRSGSSQRHTDIAFLFFVLLVKRLVEKSLRRVIFPDDIEWGKWKDHNTLTQGEGFIYESMSFRRFTPRALRRLVANL